MSKNNNIDFSKFSVQSLCNNPPLGSDMQPKKKNDSNNRNTQPYLYGRLGNHDNAQKLIDDLYKIEKADYGFLLPSGLSAMTTLLDVCWQKNTLLLLPQQAYFPLWRYIYMHKKTHMELKYDIYDINDVNNGFLNKNLPSMMKKHHVDNVILWIESPSNPIGRIIDLEHIKVMKSKHKNLLTIADNSAITGLSCAPLDYDIDFVATSLSKTYNGFHNAIGGAVLYKNSIKKTHMELCDALSEMILARGLHLGAFECWVLTQSIETLEDRLSIMHRNLLSIIDFLGNHPKVDTVFYPGSSSLKETDIAKQQLCYLGCLIGFTLKNASDHTIKSFLHMIEKDKKIGIATGYGGVNTLIECRNQIPGAHDKTINKYNVLPQNLLRLSVGLDDVEIIISSLSEALQTI